VKVFYEHRVRWVGVLGLGCLSLLLWLAIATYFEPSESQRVSESADHKPEVAMAEGEAEEGEKAHPDEPDEAARLRFLQDRNENGNIPNNALIKAAEQAEKLRTEPMPGTPPNDSPSAANIDRSLWTWRGPGNVGGRIRSIAIHPTNRQVMWAGSVGGGIWKTTDGGASWQPLDDFMANLAVSTLAIDPTNPNVLYAGTGEGFYNADSLRGAGIFKTTDGGTTWNQLPSTATSDFYTVNRLAVAPGSAGTLLAATGTGMFRSTDGGTNWTKVLSPGGKMSDVDFDPTDASKAIASGYNRRIYYSTNGGAGWTAASGMPSSADGYDGGRVEVAYAPSNPAIVYLVLDNRGGQIYKSSNGGQSYSLVNDDTNNWLGGQGWYDNALWVDPTNANTLVVGGIDLWRSTDGGTTLTKISQWQSAPNLSAHADHHVIVSHPGYNGSTNKTVFFGNDGGIYKAQDVSTVSQTSGWQELNNNLGVTQFYGGAGNASSDVRVGGTQDNGSLTDKAGTEGWQAMFGGDGGFSAADPTDSNYVYGEYIYLQIHRSTNGGTSSSYIYNGITDAGSNALFIAPFILDPNDPNTMLAGGRSLWRSTNVKATTPSWTSIKGPVGTNYTDNISAIAVAPGNSNVVWVGYANGNVYKTTNATSTSPTWTQMDLGTPFLPNRYVTRITVDPRNSNTVYATFGGFSPDNVWRTTDGGSTWSDITGSGTTGLPDSPVRTLVVNPNNSNWLYAGTEVGIFASEDGGSTWSVPTDGPANVSVDELFWMGSKLVAATHGRGMFEAETNAPQRPANDDFANAQGLTGSSATTTGTNVGATKEAGEPNHAGNAGGKSVWYKWTPQASGTATLNTAGSNFDTLLAVYRGGAVNSLTQVASNDDENNAGGVITSKLSFAATAGTTYRIAVDGYNNGAGAEAGNITLNLTSATTNLQTVQENDRDHTSYGNWAFYKDANFSGGYSSYANATGSATTFKFTGTNVTWKTQKLADGGITDIYLDGTKVATFDGYSATPQYNVTGYTKSGLASATHTLKLVVTGRKNANSSNTYTEIDRFLVGSTTYEENYFKIAYVPWSGAKNSSASGTTYRQGASKTIPAYFFYFTGPQVDLVTAKGPTRGQATVKVIDNATNTVAKTVTLNLNASTVQWQAKQSITGLDPAKTYYLQVLSADGKQVVVDAYGAALAPQSQQPASASGGAGQESGAVIEKGEAPRAVE
jgi:hypothetical protein